MSDDICRTVTFSKYDPNFKVATNCIADKTDHYMEVPGTVQETVHFCVSPAQGHEDQFDPEKVTKALNNIVEGYKTDGGWEEYYDRSEIPDYPGIVKMGLLFWLDFDEYVRSKMRGKLSGQLHRCYTSSTDDSGVAVKNHGNIYSFPANDGETWLNCMPQPPMSRGASFR